MRWTRSGGLGSRRASRALIRGESGQSLVLVVLSMTVIIAVAAFAIDAAGWMAQRHHDQVVADAAALAAANCLANPGSSAGSMDINGTPTSVPACSNGTDTTSAATVAEDYAQANGVTIGDPSKQINFDTTNDRVTIQANTSSTSAFGRLFGLVSATQSASAQASWTNTTSNGCSTPGSGCAAVFAMGSSCSDTGTPPNGSPIIFSGSNNTITGAVHSNGSIYEAGGSKEKLGPTTFGNANGTASNPCEINTSNEPNDSWNGSSTKPTTGEAPISTWPEDYSTVLTACGGAGQPACTGPCVNANLNSSYSTSQPTAAISLDPCTPTSDGLKDNCALASDGCTGTPAYCTQGAVSYQFGSGAASLPTNNVWCAFGTGSPSNPAAYTGDIEFQSGSLGSSTTPIQGTWVGGTIDIEHKSYLSTQASTPTYPVFYSAGSGDCTSSSSGGVCMSAQGNEISGAIFAPNGWIEFNGGSTTTDNFLEAQGIYFNGGTNTILGDGPTSMSGGSSGPGSDSLSQ